MPNIAMKRGTQLKRSSILLCSHLRRPSIIVLLLAAFLTIKSVSRLMVLSYCGGFLVTKR